MCILTQHKKKKPEWPNREGGREEKDSRGTKSLSVMALRKSPLNCGIVNVLNLPNYSGRYMGIHYPILITFKHFEIFHNKKEID